MERTDMLNAHTRIIKIEDLLHQAVDEYTEIPAEIQFAINNYHMDEYTVFYCLRWGLLAAKEVRFDWNNVLAGIKIDS